MIPSGFSLKMQQELSKRPSIKNRFKAIPLSQDVKNNFKSSSVFLIETFPLLE